jgi:hypothetical protein
VSEETGYCEHCGQKLPPPARPYGSQGNNKFGLTVTVVLHLLLVLLYLLRDPPDQHARPPNGATMVLLAPFKGLKKKEPPPEPRKKSRTPPTVMHIERLPNTITLPNEKPLPEVADPKPITPPAVDMQALVEARRRAREQANGVSEQAAPESDNDKAMRNIKANIAAANGRSQGDDRNDTGGVFEIANQTYHSADVKFRGWNPSFKRRWLSQVTVEQGTERDIETAIIKKMIELIRKEKKGDFIWESRVLNRNVPLSARIEDTAELEAFLFKEMFPTYRRPVGR